MPATLRQIRLSGWCNNGGLALSGRRKGQACVTGGRPSGEQLQAGLCTRPKAIHRPGLQPGAFRRGKGHRPPDRYVASVTSLEFPENVEEPESPQLAGTGTTPALGHIGGLAPSSSQEQKGQRGRGDADGLMGAEGPASTGDTDGLVATECHVCGEGRVWQGSLNRASSRDPTESKPEGLPGLWGERLLTTPPPAPGQPLRELGPSHPAVGLRG